MTNPIGIWILTLIAVIGVFITTLALNAAQKNRRRLIASGRNGARKIVANGNVLQERLRLIIQALFLYSGLAAIAIPAGSGWRATIGAAVAAASVLVTVKSGAAWRVRRLALRALEQSIPAVLPIELLPEVDPDDIPDGDMDGETSQSDTGGATMVPDGRETDGAPTMSLDEIEARTEPDEWARRLQERDGR